MSTWIVRAVQQALCTWRAVRQSKDPAVEYKGYDWKDVDLKDVQDCCDSVTVG